MPPYQAVIGSPIPGVPSLGLRMDQGALSRIEFLYSKQSVSVTAEAEPAVTAIHGYFYRKAPDRQLSLHLPGTPFQQAVWRELERIPYGSAVTYGELAGRLESSPRAVANACRANPVPLLVPCHRVVAASGLGGYLGESAGKALGIKRWLLQHEGYI